MPDTRRLSTFAVAAAVAVVIGGCGGATHSAAASGIHHLVGKSYPSPFAFSPRFGPHGEVFALGEDGLILRLRVTLFGA